MSEIEKVGLTLGIRMKVETTRHTTKVENTEAPKRGNNPGKYDGYYQSS